MWWWASSVKARTASKRRGRLLLLRDSSCPSLFLLLEAVFDFFVLCCDVDGPNVRNKVVRVAWLGRLSTLIYLAAPKGLALAVDALANLGEARGDSATGVVDPVPDLGRSSSFFRLS